MSIMKNTEPKDGILTANVEEEVYVLPPSLGQERYWALDQLNPGNPTWSVPVRFRLQGVLDPVRLESAFNEIIRRHEVLRATLKVVDGQVAQVIKPSLQISVPVVDLRDLPKTERDAKVDKLSFNEARWRFDLATGPLFRVTLLRIEDNEHVMLVTPHHSVIDYLSVGLLSNELGAIYEASMRSGEAALPMLSIQYGDFAVWQREQAESPAMQKELSYWKEQLKELPLLDFPTDRPRPSFPTYEATITSILLPVELTDAMRAIGNRESATFFNTILAALGVLMHQYTGQTDFGAATQVAGRNSVELESLIGPFINTVVLRLDMSGDPTYPQLLRRVQEMGLQSIANQNVRFEQVLRDLRPQDYPSHHTLFRLNFICQRDPVKPQEFAGIKLTVIPSKSQGALYDLHVFLVSRNEGWRLACEYNTDLYEAATITRLLGDFRALLEEITKDPNRALSKFPLPEGALLMRQRSSQVSGGGAEVPLPRALGAAAAMPVTLGPELPPTHYEEPASEAFGMPASVAQQRFYALEEIVPGNPALHMRACVRLAGDVSVEALERSLSVLTDRHEILRTTFEKSENELLQVIHPSVAIALQVTSLGKVADADREAKLWESIREEARAPFDLSFGPLIRGRLFRLAPQEHVLMITTHHIVVDGWSQNVIQQDFWAIYHAISKGEKPALADLAVQYVDFTQWQKNWLVSDSARDEIEFWKTKLAAPLSVLNFPTDRPPQNRPASHGAMETLLLAPDLTKAMKELSQANGVTTFMALLTCYAALLCRYAGQEEIILSSPVANRKPETEGLIGPFASPIALRLNVGGNPTLKELLQRVNDATSEALNHAELPFEVLMEHLHVRSSHGRNPLSQCYFFYQLAFLRPRELDGLVVTPLPDFALGTHFELQMGLLDRREGLRAQLEYNPDLFDAPTIRQVLEDYKRALELMRDVPESRLSDIQVSRQAIAAATLPTETAGEEPRRPANSTERKLQEIWESLLGVSPIGLNQNYFELGGTSILAVRLFSKIASEFGQKLPLSILFEAQTIARLARVLREDGHSAGWSPLVAVQPKGSRPPFFCVHAAGGNVLVYRELSEHLGADQPFFGLQAQGLDGERPILETIEDMATLYVNEVRRFQPHGPYFLGGYCMGGTVAFEMAQQLRSQGEEVALLALFDTLNWCNIPADNAWRRMRQAFQRLKFHGYNFVLLDGGEKGQFLQEKLSSLRSRAKIWRGILLNKFSRKRKDNLSESRVLGDMWQINDRSSVAYVAKPYDGVVTDFRPMRQYSKYRPAEDDWSRLALRGVELITLPVYPAGMLLSPFVKHLANALNVCISRTIRNTR